MFAERTNWTLSENRISEIIKNLRDEKKEIIDLTISNPSVCGFSYPKDEILESLNTEENIIYEPSSFGLDHARKAVCEYYAEKNIIVEPANIFLTASTSEAYSFLFRLLANPSDSVLFPRPSYPLFDFLVGLNDLKMKNYSLVYSDGWSVDIDSLRSSVSENTKALVLVNPNNPTGSFLKKEEIDGINDICEAKNIPIICDEVFEDYLFDEQASFPSLVNNKKNLTFVLGGLSKTLGLPQMKVSWIVISGLEEKVKEASARLEVITDTYLSVNTPSQNALSKWLKLRPKIQNEIKERIRKNRARLEEIFSNVDGCEYISADGGWYAIVKLPKKFKEESFALELLKEENVFVHPGYFFDFLDEPYIVLSLLVLENMFDEGLSRIKKFISS